MLDRALGMLLIGLVLGGGLGFATAASYGVTLEGHDHGGHDHGGHDAAEGTGHSHSHDEMMEVSGPEAPTVDLEVAPDPASGWNLHIVTTHFRFAPEHAGQGDVPGEGHAHLYLNGEKIARIYGDWYHLAALPAGQNVLRVGLYSNSHKALAVNGAHLETEITLAE
ncbi:hypothetical protein [Albibacillus kandeliae]|uniref:hypothetical protein n=1 Tax=Albibacillus kandeliae TaxID=2174228 RepID=UPI000D68DE3F|nr:hypothetical protein [Albibacillus kandeliae]